MRSLNTILAATSVVIVMGAVDVLAGAGCCEVEAKRSAAVELKPQTTCPVMGGKIDKSQYADVKGKRIYVCCAGCIGKIKADPDKYIEQLEKDGVKLKVAPEKK